jgi:hypothetical protein
MYRTKRGKKLTSSQKLFNKPVAKKRFVVERCFGAITQKF